MIDHRELEAFFGYLSDHLSDNGIGQTAKFQPSSIEESNLSDSTKLRFMEGLKAELGSSGWRRLWLAFEGDEIVGHIDIRAHSLNHTSHRALLGMGVDRNKRNIGVGRQLMQQMFDWTRKNTNIDYVDLCVLSSNINAQRLYEKQGFTKCGEIEDMFRIDGESYSHTMMSRRVTVN